MQLSTEITRPFADRIARTELSGVLGKYDWIVPTSQSLHIVCVALLFIGTLIISLRLIGLRESDHSLSVDVRRLTRLMYMAFGGLLFTGTLQIIAEPVRQFVAPIFWVKMSLVLLGLAMSRWFAMKVYREPDRWDMVGSRPTWSTAYAVISLATWLIIIICGRFIGYTWMEYA